MGQDIHEKMFTPEPTTLLSPMGELCKALEAMRIKSTQKETSSKQSTLVTYTCIVKSCKVCQYVKIIIYININ